MKDRHVRGRFAERGKQRSEMFRRRGAHRFISDDSEIVAARELIQPVVHRLNDGANSEPFVAQEVADSFFLELGRRAGVAPGHLHIKRNETVARVPHNQNDLCSTELLSRDQVFATDSVPKAAFRPVLEQIMGKNEPGDARFAISFWLEGELAAVTFAEISAKKCPDPCTSTFGDRKDDSFAPRKFGRSTTEIPAH